MPKFVFSSPIIVGKSDVVRYVYRKRRENPQLVGNEGDFHQKLGVTEWQTWLQKTPRGHFFIQSLQIESLNQLFSSLQTLIRQEDPKALWLRDFYLEILGRDYTDPSAAPTLLPLFQWDLELPYYHERGEIISQGYLLPLLPKKIDAYREFCRQISGEHRGRIEETCRQFSIGKVAFSLQKTLAYDYIMIYREKALLPQELAKRPHEIRASSPAYQWVSNQLMDLSGLPFDQLEPQLESLSPQPLSALPSHFSLLQPA